MINLTEYGFKVEARAPQVESMPIEEVIKTYMSTNHKKWKIDLSTEAAISYTRGSAEVYFTLLIDSVDLHFSIDNGRQILESGFKNDADRERVHTVIANAFTKASGLMSENIQHYTELLEAFKKG